jgi:hypothetical protein
MKHLYAMAATIGLFASAHCLAAAPAAAPAGATGLCKDGTYYTGAEKKGACRGHKGVKDWYADATAAKSDAKPVAPKPATAAASTAAPAGATGLCKDGTYYTGAEKKGACRGHKGVKDWYADATAAKNDAKPEAPTPTTAAAPKPPTTAAPTAAPAGATGLCKDGTYYTGAQKKGACRGHKGVKDWYADATAAKSDAKPEAPKPATAAASASAPTAPATAASTAKATPAPAAAAAAGGGAGKVWVNASTKVYHCEGDRWYGKTKNGEYMTETDAKAKGFKADHGKACQ